MVLRRQINHSSFFGGYHVKNKKTKASLSIFTCYVNASIINILFHICR